MDVAFQTSLESLRIASECGDIFAKAAAHAAHGASCFGRGWFNEAENFLTEAAAFSERMNESAWGATACGLLGDLYTETGMYQKARHYLNRGLSIMKNAQILFSFRNWSHLVLKKVAVLRDEADINGDELYENYETNNLKVFEGWNAREIGEILLNIDRKHYSQAEDWIQKAIEADTRNRMIWHLGRDYALYAKIYKRKGELSKATENWAKAIEIFQECGADGWVGKCEEEMANFS
jgi:tetratricopeptide (TPR) repeat protein